MQGKTLLIIAVTSVLTLPAFGQKISYEVFALKFATNGKVPINAIAVGANTKDSVQICYMVWLLKGTNGKTVLVDAGFVDTVKLGLRKYIRPDLALQRFGIQAKDITDVILTHPHTDHVNGIDLFPNAMVWMQKADFEYFVGEAWQKGGVTTGLKKADVQKLVQRNLDKKLMLVKGDGIKIMPGIKVFTGSRHTYESQFVQVETKSDNVIVASDNSWFYYNLVNELSIPLTFDQQGYRDNLRRMKTFVTKIDLIIPGHDPLVFSKFPKVAEDVVRIGN